MTPHTCFSLSCEYISLFLLPSIYIWHVYIINITLELYLLIRTNMMYVRSGASMLTIRIHAFYVVMTHIHNEPNQKSPTHTETVNDLHRERNDCLLPLLTRRNSILSRNLLYCISSHLYGGLKEKKNGICYVYFHISISLFVVIVSVEVDIAQV